MSITKGKSTMYPKVEYAESLSLTLYIYFFINNNYLIKTI